jgi:hypothetical protein
MRDSIDFVHRRTHALLACAFAVMTALGSAISYGATPPPLVNYQGVLRDSMGKPLDGTFDMTFHFYNALTAGDELLMDAHTGGGGVVVTGGVFNVLLGGGVVTDRSGQGIWTSLDLVFAAYATVYLEVQVGSETLSPRTRLVAAPYSLNTSTLAGNPASYYLDTSPADQDKSGALTGHGGLVAYNDSGKGSGFGVWGRGRQGGGEFRDSDQSGFADVAIGDVGIAASGSAYGAYLADTHGNYVYVAESTNGWNYGLLSLGRDIGVNGTGSYAGGDFFGYPSSGEARVGFGDLGIDGSGLQAGGHFHKPGTNAPGLSRRRRRLRVPGRPLRNLQRRGGVSRLLLEPADRQLRLCRLRLLQDRRQRQRRIRAERPHGRHADHPVHRAGRR